MLGAPVDFSAPSTSLGSADAYGKLRLWIEIDEIDFGDGLEIPFRFEFSSSEANRNSPYLGSGFWCPLISANCYLKRERMMKATLPCGKTMFLERERANPSKFHTVNREWTGLMEGDDFIVSREDGWALRYRSGKIHSLRTDAGRMLTWIYSGDLVTEIREEKSSTLPFKVVFGAPNVPSGFHVNGKAHSFEMGERPRVENIQGKNIIGGIDKALNTWQFPNGKKETFTFEVTSSMQPNLTHKDRSNASNTYAWDARTGYILSENGWTYQIESVAKSDIPKLKRVDSQGVEEFLNINNRTGVTERKLLNQPHIVTQVFKNEGPLYGKVRKVEEVNGNEKSVVYQASYDQFGRILRKTDSLGLVTSYVRDEKGKITAKSVSLSDDPRITKPLKEKEATLLQEISRAESLPVAQKLLVRLCDLYIHELKQPAKALELLPRITAVGSRYVVQLQAVDQDESLSPKQKIVEYKKLLELYPQHEATIASLIKIRETEEY